MKIKKRALVVCPGRGTYTKDTLGYLKTYGSHIESFLDDIDQRRRERDEPTIRALDSAEVFKSHVHTRGEHASSLIYAAAYADFMAIDREQFEISAITGNSMGWYLTLAFGEALDRAGAFDVINTMGSMMKEEIIGNQVIYPIINEQWQKQPESRKIVFDLLKEINKREFHEAHLSIELGGYLVLGANKLGTQALLKELPKNGDYPFQLINHAAFHTPLLEETSRKAFSILAPELFQAPRVPLIDGRGHIWQPYSTDTHQLHQYTLGHQVVAPYDYTQAITVGLKEFCPDVVILLGPGSSLGGATAQILIENQWHNLKSKEDFTNRQAENPFIFSMGRPEQRAKVTNQKGQY